MIEVELKSVVDDWSRRRAVVERAGARLVFDGRLEDRRYDTADRALAAQDHVLRLRTYRTATETHAELDWKGPTRKEHGFKLREELDAQLLDGAALAVILGRLGYVVTTSIDRRITQYELHGATVRFERYPRLDDLVEVEGTPDDIERAIAAIGLPRAGYTADRLSDFVARYEARTGERAATCDAALESSQWHG
jgi:predicted adenylyl cyclase CyaB